MVDPGIGKVNAKAGSREWAERWRLEIQSAVKGADFDIKQFEKLFDVGKQHRAWTKLTDKEGNMFIAWDEFAKAKIPFGLGRDPKKLRKLLEAKNGKQWVQLETVPEPQKGKRNDLTCHHDGETLSKNTAHRLRAINRAPEVVKQLWVEGLIPQVDAAKLGKLDIADEQKIEISATVAAVIEETKDLPQKERKKTITKAVREIHGCDAKYMRVRADSVSEAAKALLKHYSKPELIEAIQLAGASNAT